MQFAVSPSLSNFTERERESRFYPKLLSQRQIFTVLNFYENQSLSQEKKRSATLSSAFKLKGVF